MPDEIAQIEAPTNIAPDAQALEQTNGNGAPETKPKVEAKPRPESPVTWDEATNRWVTKTKVDGKESVVAFEDLHRDAQQSRSAQERYEKAKEIARRNGELERTALSYQEALKNPQRAFDTWAAMGLDPHAMLEQLYAHADAEAKLTPEQRELREYRAQQAQRQEQERQAAERARAEEEAAEQRAYDERYDKAFTAGLTKAGVPDDPILRGHLSHILWAMHDRQIETGGGKMPLGEAVGQAIDSMKSMTAHVLSMMSPEERLQHLGPEVVEQLVAARLANAAPIPSGVPHHNDAQPRGSDGKFVRHTTFRPGSNFFGP